MKKILLLTLILCCHSRIIAQISEEMPSPEAITSPCGMNILNNKLLFVGMTQLHGKELWSTDGTLAGTGLLKEINNEYNVNALNAFPYTNSLNSEGYFGILNNQMFFTASSTYSGGEPRLWVTDGTTAGTFKFIIPGTTFINVRWYKKFNNRLYFLAQTVAQGLELWSTDGTVAGTVMVKDINPEMQNAFNINLDPNFLVFGNRLYFKATDGVHGLELWSTDGTTGGTTLFKDINDISLGVLGYNSAFNAGNFNNISPLIDTGDFFYFSACDAVYNSLSKLFKSNGTPEGTVPIIAPPAVVGSTNYYSRPTGMTKFNNMLYFFAETSTPTIGVQRGLYKLNLTTQTVTFLKQFIGAYGDNGLSDATPRGSMREYNGKLYFVADDGSDYKLWSTDGTSDGTQAVFATNTNDDSFDTTYLFRSQVYDNKLYFVAGSTYIENVYSTDGTTAGTVALFSQNMIYGPQQFTKFNQTLTSDKTMDENVGSLYFATSHNTAAGVQMWRLRPETLSVTNPFEKIVVKAFPNPTQGKLTVQFSNEISDGKMTLTNMLRQIVVQKTGLNGSSHEFDFTDLSKGMYVLQVVSDLGTQSTKIIID